MFLRSLERSNPAFLRAVTELHQSGHIPANSYVVDLDAVAENARHIIGEAREYQLTVFPMTKQYGRNPIVNEALARAGADGFVAVDMQCARPIASAGLKLGHVGHLVQIPRHEVLEALSLQPSYWTVFSLAQAKRISDAKPAHTQRVLLRVYGPDDVIVPTHAGGFDVREIERTIDAISALPGLEVCGVTTYPSAHLDRLARHVLPTPNVESLRKAAEVLRRLGVEKPVVNMASELSTATIAMAADAGATQIEPGHAFTGTSPLQALQAVPERQAIVYLTEVSHLHSGGAFCFGGGLYECIGAVEHDHEALIGTDGGDGERFVRARLTNPPAGVIDFYGRLDFPTHTGIRGGETVLICTRPQAFFTRAYVVPVEGIQRGAPRVLGVWNTSGYIAQNAPAHTLSV